MTLSGRVKAVAPPIAVALLVFGGGVAVTRGCTKPPAPAVVEKTDADEVIRRLREANERLKTSSAKTVKRAPVVDEKFDAKTGALVERKTVGAVESAEQKKTDDVKVTREVEQTTAHVHSERTVTPAPPADPRLRVYASGEWRAPGLDLAAVSLRPVARVGAEVRLIDRLSLDVRYEPPFLNADKHHNVSAELKLTIFEWR